MIKCFWGTLFCSVAILGFAGCGSMTAPAIQQASLDSKDTRQSFCSEPWIADGKPYRCRVNQSASWMKGSTSGELLYVSDIGAESVDVFSYPAKKLVGTLTGFVEPNGLCADKKGNVFVADSFDARIVEYAHGGTSSIATLGTGGIPIDCAVDPGSGDLAVTFYTNAKNSGSFSIYKNATGFGTSYAGLYRTFFCTYDGSGNLFLDGFNTGGNVALGELAKGASSMLAINPQGFDPGWAGGLQWDGKNLALGDQIADKYSPSKSYRNAVYKISISGQVAPLIKTVPLLGGQDIIQFWLDGQTIIGPDASRGDVANYKYPKGGKATGEITGLYEPVGAALSK